MSLPQNHDTRKTIDNQEPTEKRTARLLATMSKFRVTRKQQDLEVRLKHEFLMAWAPILRPITFKVYVMVERFAYFGAGPLHGHTNGWVSLGELADVCGTTRRRLSVALGELITYGLVTCNKADPAARQHGGKKLDLEVDQTARPSLALLTRKRRPPAQTGADVDAQTYTPISTRSCTPIDTRSCTPSDTRSCTPVDTRTFTPIGTRSNYGSNVSQESDLGTVSPSSSLSTAKTDDDEHAEKPTDLNQIRQTLPYIVDDSWLTELWTEARAAAPDITVDELSRVFACKIQILKGKTVSNPVAYLKTAVLRAITGEGLGEYRAWFTVAAVASGGTWKP